jgi:hypothetical protein
MLLMQITSDLVSDQCSHADCTTSYLNDYIAIFNSKTECAVPDSEVELYLYCCSSFGSFHHLVYRYQEAKMRCIQFSEHAIPKSTNRSSCVQHMLIVQQGFPVILQLICVHHCPLRKKKITSHVYLQT